MSKNVQAVKLIEPIEFDENHSIPVLKDVKKLFIKKGPCSHALFYILNREFGNRMDAEEYASDPLAGGIMQQGHQCGMLWGTTLAAGAESYKRFAKRDEAIGMAITAAGYLVESFSQRAKTVHCSDITSADWSSKTSMVKYFISGRFLSCFKLADKWAPEAIQSAYEGLSCRQLHYQKPVSCASLVAEKMGASDRERVMVAGFAGGIGLSGNACGALSAAIWMRSLAWCRENPGESPYMKPVTKDIIEDFYKATDYEIECKNISGQSFDSIGEHTEYINNGGCKKLINMLAEL